MLAVSVKINNEKACQASTKDLSLLIGGMCGGKTGKHAVRLGGVKELDDEKSIHSQWLEDRVDVGDTVTIEIKHDDGDSLPPRNTKEFSFKDIRRKIRALEKKSKNKPIAPKPPDKYDNITYVININEEPPVVANILNYDQLQLDIWISVEKEIIDFKVGANASTDGKGGVQWHDYIDRQLDIGDIIQIILENPPNQQIKRDAVNGAA